MPLTEGRYRRVQMEIMAITAGIVLMVAAFLGYVFHADRDRLEETTKIRTEFCRDLTQLQTAIYQVLIDARSFDYAQRFQNPPDCQKYYDVRKGK